MPTKFRKNGIILYNHFMISYRKVRDLIEDNDITHKDIRVATGLGKDTLAKLGNDEYISMDSLERLARYLSAITGRKLQPSDLFEFL
jgi:DNA-binding Xre family transcriptional regulator